MLPDLAPSLILLGLAILILPGLCRENPKARIAVMAVGIACMLQYLVWRFTATLPAPSLAPGTLWMWLLAVMEALAMANGLLTMVFLSRPSRRRAEADIAEARLAARPFRPGIDVLIPTYNEPIDVLERSIAGALALDWPAVEVWVLDDGERPWLRDYCAARGVRWVTRAGRSHGKAGNVNAWLESGAGRAPFVMLLDADFVPQRRFLKRVIGFFDDQAVALVQTPQSFFNPDPIQLNLLCGNALADEQRFFYHVFQPSLDAWGAAFCCGTSFVIRRDRLDAIGGIPTCTVTEDMMTTYALAVRGWRTIYLNEALSTGLAAEGLSEFVGQRARWCLGTVQALTSPRSPFRAKGLGWAHRLCFLNAQFFWLASVPLMLLSMLAPVMFWWFGMPAFLAHPESFLAHFGPRFLAEAIAMGWVSRWTVVPILSGLAPLVIAPAALRAAIAGLSRRPQAFRVTRKGTMLVSASRRARAETVIHGRTIGWLAGIMAAIAAGIAAADLHLFGSAGMASVTTINVIWSGYAFLILFLAMLVCVEIPRRRREERVDWAEPVLVDGEPCQLTDLSVNGACVAIDLPGATVALDIPEVGRLAAWVVRREGGRMSLEFVDREVLRGPLLRKLFTSPSILDEDGPRPMRAFGRALRRSFVSQI